MQRNYRNSSLSPQTKLQQWLKIVLLQNK